MIGQGSPRKWNNRICLAMRGYHGAIRLIACLVLVTTAWHSVLAAEEVSIRLRLAWGSGDGAKHRWLGRISCPGATLSHLQPLGIESDAPAAVLLVENDLIIDPLEKRGFDGCDITVSGPGESVLRIELQSDQSSTPKLVEASLSRLAGEQIREPIDSMGSFLLAYRCPGDRFRVLPTRKHLIFDPAELWQLRLMTDFGTELLQGPIVVEAVLRSIGSESVLWQSSQLISSESPASDQLAIDLTCPTLEGAYRLSLTASTEEGFATRLVPGQNVKPFATREIDFVVINPAAKLPIMADSWLPLLSIDPANPSWWQRLPSWAQVSRLTGKPPGSLGNVRLLPHSGQVEGLVELAPSTSKQNLTWQSFALPIQEVGVPHLVEISYPLAVSQHLGVSIIEPDAAGRVTSTTLDSGFIVKEAVDSSPTQLGVHRVIFWPRTSSPQLLIVNHRASSPGVFGQITLSRQNDAASQKHETINGPELRMVAGYIAKPVFAQNLGAAEVLDPASGMSVQSWSTFLDGARRLTQYLRLSGYNSTLLSVAADGSALYPSEVLTPSPRYDTGQMAASGQDPQRKDVLEMLLRIYDREQLRLIPTIQLAFPLPRIEGLRRTESEQDKGIVWLDAQGRQLSEARPNAKLSANYNLLNPRIQQEVAEAILELAQRYGHHSSMAGIALQLDSNGFGTLPGLEWGFDDQTVAAFSSETGFDLTAEGEGRFQKRARILTTDYRQAWQEWRIKKVIEFYRSLAERVQARRNDFKLVLTTEELFAEPALQQAVRAAVSNPILVQDLLAERGIDLSRLATIPGMEVTNTWRLSNKEYLQEHVSDVILNDLAQYDELLSTERDTLNLAFQDFQYLRLPSFDQLSPFGTERTHLVLTHYAKPAITMAPTFAVLLKDNPTNTIIEGGDYLSMALDPSHVKSLRRWARLPSATSATRVLKQQPIVVWTSQSSSETYIACANESPWTITAELEIDSPQNATWEEIEHQGDIEPKGSAVGKVPVGKSRLELQLSPGALRVWKFDSSKVRVGELKVPVNPAVREFLSHKLEEIESRTGNLNIQRDFPQLQNPGFELEEGTSRIFGWQGCKGVKGAELESADVHSGVYSLRLKSEDPLGVAVQSHLFPLPATGMLVVKAHVRVAQAGDDAQMVVALETEDANFYHRTHSVPIASEIRNQWTQIEFVVNDLPVGAAEQLRILFHVTGKADVVLDDIQLCDLRFDDQRRTELVKRVFSAKTALEENQFVDCLRLLDEYWPRYLVEYVPPAERTAPKIAKQPESSSTKEEEAKSKSRLRGWMPRLFR